MINIRDELFSLSEEKYKEFSSNLLPGTDNIIGVRLPVLRKMAKNISKENWRRYLSKSSDEYFEEVMLQGMVIGYANDTNIEEILQYITTFVPKINNWSVCDSFCNGLKITNSNKDRVFEFLMQYLKSDNEFEVRFAVVMMICFFIEEDYICDVLDKLDNINNEGYYAKMAVAWAVSMCYVKFEKTTMKYLQNNNLDDFTYNKSIQKICESLKVDKEMKKYVRSMKR